MRPLQTAAIVTAIAAALLCLSIPRLAADEVSAPGTLLFVAGALGDGGDDGPAAQALFALPWGPATQARLAGPIGIALDAGRNLYIADFVNRRIRKVSPDGVISTFAGGGNPADGLGDGGPATEARLLGPTGVAVDPGGNHCIVGNRGARVRKIDTSGIISTVAGDGKIGFCPAGVGGPATAVSLNGSVGLALDAAGNLYFTDVGRIESNGGSINVVGTRVLKVIGVAVPR